ncbi:MAG: 6-phosphogluconolactonase [bacterium]|nr:6-phosphogluconolactonase [bacterium]
MSVIAKAIQISPDLESLSHSAAGWFVQKVQSAVSLRGSCCVALSGGSTPMRAYQLLAAPMYRDQVPWEKLHVFWVDERLVPPDDRRSNQCMIREVLLNKVPIPPEQIYPVRCDQSAWNAAREYEELLKHFFKSKQTYFDLILLGLGENGHTASLFPGTPALLEQDRWVVDVYVTDQDLFRVSLTVPFINLAEQVAFLVAGHSKATVLHEVLEGSPEPDRLPAQLIHPANGNLLWMIDREAAGKLTGASLNL